MSLFKAVNHYCKVQIESEVEIIRKGVLVVDDSKFSRNILIDMLKTEGHLIVGEAQDGLEAIDMAREKKPEYVFLDVEMPKLDGIGAISKILEVDPEIKIIMCTALGQKNIILEAAKAGAKDYVIKPYLKENIIGVLNLVSEKKQKDGQVIPFKPGKKNQDDFNNIVTDEKLVEPRTNVKELNIESDYRTNIDMLDLLEPLEYEDDFASEEALDSLLDSECLLGSIDDEMLESYISEETLEVSDKAEVDSEHESELESEFGIKPKLETEPRLGTECKLETESELKQETEAELKLEAESELDLEAETKLDLEAGTNPETEYETESKLETESELKLETESELKLETEIEPKLESETELEAEPKLENETESEPELVTESKLDTESKEVMMMIEATEEETVEIAEYLEAILNDEKSDEEEEERAKFVEAILREEALNTYSEEDDKPDEALMNEGTSDIKTKGDANPEETIVYEETSSTRAEGTNLEKTIVNEDTTENRAEGDAKSEEAKVNEETSSTRAEGANPEAAIVNEYTSDTRAEGEAKFVESIINEETSSTRAEGANPEKTIVNEDTSENRAEGEAKSVESKMNDELLATKTEEGKLDGSIMNQELSDTNEEEVILDEAKPGKIVVNSETLDTLEDDSKSEEAVVSKEVPIGVYLFADTLQDNTSDSHSYTYLWNNRFDLMQKEYKLQKTVSQRVSFYEYAYLETDRDNIFGNYYSNREMLLGIMNAYMASEDRLQITDTTTFEVKPITYPKEIRLFTSNILEENNNEFTEVTIMNAIKYNSLKPKRNSQEITNRTGFYQVISDFVNGKSGRVLR